MKLESKLAAPLQHYRAHSGQFSTRVPRELYPRGAPGLVPLEARRATLAGKMTSALSGWWRAPYLGISLSSALGDHCVGCAVFCSNAKSGFEAEEVSASPLTPFAPSLCRLSDSTVTGCRLAGVPLSGPWLGLYRTRLCLVNMEVLKARVEKRHFLFINERKYFYCLS